MKIKIVLILALFTFSLLLTAQNGLLDLTFGNNGIVNTDIGNSSINTSLVALQSDGKIVVAVNFDNGATSDFIVTRYNVDGSLDTNFGNGGKVTTTIIGTTYKRVSSVAIQNDGKIVVAAYAGMGNGIAVIRYNSNGSLDTNFDSDGIVTTSIGNNYTSPAAVAIQSDGKIVVAGDFDNVNGTNSNFAVIRYNANGSLDSSFDNDGIVTTLIGGTGEHANAMAIQNDGKIVVTGYTYSNSANFIVARYNSNGSLDTGFDTDGILTMGIGNGSDVATSVALQNDGKIVVAGYYNNGSDDDFVVVRYNSNGSLDTSFDADGIVTASIGTGDFTTSLTIQNDGKIVVTGYTVISVNSDFVVIRYNTNGSLDTGFDTDGIVITPIGSGNAVATSVAIQSDGKIVVAGYSPDFVVVRYDANGSLDTSFDTDGKVISSFGKGNDNAASVAIQSDGKIVVVGHSFNGSNNDFAIARYNANGNLDNSFDTDGKVTTAIGSGNDVANSVAIQSDGKIVVAGQSDNGSNNDFAITRYNANGSLDTSFDTDGKVTTAIGTTSNIAASVAIQSDGKIVVAGYTGSGSNSDFAVIRYNTNGSLDSSFDNDGIVTTAIGTSIDIAYSVAIQSDGKIVVAGQSRSGINTDFAITRYNANGSLDISFDNDGKVTTAIGSGNDVANSVAIQSDGKIVVTGYSFNGSNNDFAVTRYNSNGSLDTNFDTDGKVTTAIGNGNDIANSVAMQSDGKIVVAGQSFNGSDNDIAVLKYNANGSLDAGFDTDGIVTTAIGSDTDLAKSVAIQNDGKIVVVGYYRSSDKADYDFSLLRYNSNFVGIENLVPYLPIVSLYPNPTTGAISINFGKQMDIVSINIKNILGQTISTKQLTSTNVALLNIEGASGLYFVEVQTANETSVIKVQKN